MLFMDYLLLDDKYKFAWNEYGTPDGEPIFYFHGTPGSRLEASSADVIARDLGIRLIAPERPGYGNSEAQDEFSLLNWPNAVSQLADKLNLKHFSLIGYSGGGPYALACAHKIADRIKKITLIGSLAPFESDAMQKHINACFKPLYELTVTDYPLAMQQVSQLTSSPEALLDALYTQLSAVDLTIVKQENFRALHLENMAQALNNGVHGFVNDLRNYTLPWQFGIHTIPHRIDIWHGCDDQNVGFAIGEYLAETMQNTSAHFLDKAGHYFLFDQWQVILQSTKE